MRNGKKSIADMAVENPTEEACPETVFEESDALLCAERPPSFLSRKIIQYSFGFFTNETKINNTLVILAGIVFFATIILIVRLGVPANKVPSDVLKASMERMRPR